METPMDPWMKEFRSVLHENANIWCQEAAFYIDIMPVWTKLAKDHNFVTELFSMVTYVCRYECRTEEGFILGPTAK